MSKTTVYWCVKCERLVFHDPDTVPRCRECWRVMAVLTKPFKSRKKAEKWAKRHICFSDGNTK